MVINYCMCLLNFCGYESARLVYNYTPQEVGVSLFVACFKAWACIVWFEGSHKSKELLPSQVNNDHCLVLYNVISDLFHNSSEVAI